MEKGKIYVHDRWNELTDNYKITLMRIYYLQNNIEPIDDIPKFQEYVSENIDGYIRELQEFAE